MDAENAVEHSFSSSYLRANEDPENSKTLISNYEEMLSKTTESLRAIETPVAPEVMEEVQRSRQLLQNRVDRINPEVTIPPFFFVSRQGYENFTGADKVRGPFRPMIPLGQTFSEAGSIVVVEPYLDNLELATLAYHEQSHSTAITIKSIGFKRIWPHISGGLIGPQNLSTKGYIFEEGFVIADTEKYFQNNLKNVFPEEWDKKIKAAESIGSTVPSSVYPDGDSPEPEFAVGVGSLAAEVYSKLDTNIPHLHESVIEARLTGKWGKVVDLVDSRYERGTFKRLFSVGGMDIDKKLEDAHDFLQKKR